MQATELGTCATMTFRPSASLAIVCNGSKNQTTGKLLISLTKKLDARTEIIFRGTPSGLVRKLASILTSEVRVLQSLWKCDGLIVHSALSLNLLSLLAARILRRRSTAFVWDIYPMRASRSDAPRRSLRNWLFQQGEWLGYRLANTLAVPSGDYIRSLPANLHHKTVVVPLWPAERVRDISENERTLGDPIKVAYAGQINAFRGFAKAIEILGECADCKAIEVHIFSRDTVPTGLGLRLERFPHLTLSYRGFLEGAEYEEALAQMDFGLVPLDTELNRPAFPSKILSYISAGLPVFLIAPTHMTDLHHIVSSYHLGIPVNNGQFFGKDDLNEMIMLFRDGRERFLIDTQKGVMKIANIY